MAGLLGRLGRLVSDWHQRRKWDERWRDPEFQPAWLEDGARRQVRDAVADGWLRPGATVLDLGCGSANSAAWLAREGFRVTAVDFSKPAIDRARREHGDVPGLSLVLGDVAHPLPISGTFDALLDLGCLHQLPANALAGYGDNVRRLSREGSRLLMLMRRWRNAPEESAEAKADRVLRLLGPEFELLDLAPEDLDSEASAEVRPGVIVRLGRRGRQSGSYHGSDPGPPLNGPTRSGVIQPP